MKTCSKCGESRALDGFHKNSKCAGGFNTICKTCHAANTKAYVERNSAKVAEYKKQWAAANVEHRAEYAKEYYAGISPEKRAASARKHKYGLSAEVYADMVARQKGRCAICGRPPQKQGLCVDHDHDTGAVRDLLCSNCNTAMGKLGDDPRRMRAAAEYLERHQGRLLSDSPHNTVTNLIVQGKT